VDRWEGRQSLEPGARSNKKKGAERRGGPIRWKGRIFISQTQPKKAWSTKLKAREKESGKNLLLEGKVQRSDGGKSREEGSCFCRQADMNEKKQKNGKKKEAIRSGDRLTVRGVGRC